ncbi:MAG: OB-fold nucleic acid binding domain-containing protein, partial [Candidatus Spechtbacterales bacterium]
ANYPTEFASALLNAEQKNIDRLAFIIEEVSSMNIELLPPSVNESGYNFTVVNEGTIRFGLAAIKNVGANIVNEIIEERNKNGSFASLENILERIVSRGMNKKSLESLIKAGALDELGDRNTLIANMDNLLQYSKENKQAQNAGQFSLFAGTETETDNKIKLQKAEAASQKEKLTWEKELLGFYVSGHPLKEHREKLVGSTPINSLIERPTAINCKIGAVINSAKKITTKKGDPMMFVGLEDLTGKMEAIVFPSLFEKKHELLEEGRLVIAEGKVNTRDGDVKFICENITELA